MDNTKTRINRLNFQLVVFQISLHIYCFYFSPYLFSTTNILLLNAVIVAALSTNQLWSLIHEGVHGLLSTNKKMNSFLFSLLSIAFGSSSTLLKAVHLYHHRYNRSDYELVEAYKEHENRTAIAAYYYFNLIIGLYIRELCVPFISYLSERRLRGLQKGFFSNNRQICKLIDYYLLHPRELRMIRLELLLVVLTYSFAFYLLADNWPVLLAFMAVRGFLISFADYIYHYETPLGDKLHGKNLKLPHFVSKYLLHFNFHGIHHQHQTVSWYELPKMFKNQAHNFDGHYFKAALIQLKGPIREDQLPQRESL